MSAPPSVDQKGGEDLADDLFRSLGIRFTGRSFVFEMDVTTVDRRVNFRFIIFSSSPLSFVRPALKDL